MVVKKRTWEVVGLVTILAVTAFFRLYRLSDTLHWRGDEGRDASIIRKMVLTHHPVLIGPPTSVVTAAGSLYLGPLTFYLMAPGLWLSGGSPLSPAITVILFSLATVWLLWLVGRSWFSPVVGWLAAGIFALSPNAIIFGRHGWNPNFMPFFALLTVWCFWKAWSQGRSWWWVAAAGSLMATVQVHPTGWALLPVGIITWLLGLHRALRAPEKKERRQFFLTSLAAVVVGGVMMLPLMIYDAMHQGHSWRVIKAYLHQSGTTHQSVAVVVQQFFIQLRLSVQDILVGFHIRLAWIIVAILSAGDIIYFLQSGDKERKAIGLLGGWIIFSGAALALFSGPIFIQYREVLWSAVALLVSWFLWRLSKRWVSDRVMMFSSAAVFLVVAVIMLVKNQAIFPTDNDYQSTKTATAIIQANSSNQPFSLGTLSARKNSDSAYRYVLTWKFHPPVEIAVSHQAYIICEDTDCSQKNAGVLRAVTWPDVQYRTSWKLSPTVTMVKVVR